MLKHCKYIYLYFLLFSISTRWWRIILVYSFVWWIRNVSWRFWFKQGYRFVFTPYVHVYVCIHVTIICIFEKNEIANSSQSLILVTMHANVLIVYILGKLISHSLEVYVLVTFGMALLLLNCLNLVTMHTCIILVVPDYICVIFRISLVLFSLFLYMHIYV